jgi:membrane protease YdiL (CAAX protease family)
MSSPDTIPAASNHNRFLSTVTLFVVALALFAIAAATPPVLAWLGIVDLDAIAPWLPHFVVKILMIAMAWIAVTITGKGTADGLGLRGATPPVHWLRTTLIGFALGAGASTVVMLTPAAGMQSLFAGWSFPAIALSIWIYSSVSEELFVRGWFQRAVEGAAIGSRGLFGGRVSIPVATSAALFGAIHLSLLTKGIDIATTAIIVVATTALGLVAATLRERHRGLLPSIVVHVCFNLGGVAAGIVITIIRHVVASGGAH